MSNFTIKRWYVPECEEQNAFNAASDPTTTRNVMAGFYADLLRCAAVRGRESINFKAVNAAILARWPRGLEYIKTLAWKEATQ